MAFDKSAARRRVITAILATVLGTVAAGCGATKSSSSCENAVCEIELSGEEANVELDTANLKVVLAGTTDGKAELKLMRIAAVREETVKLAEGESGVSFSYGITVEEVDGDKVRLRMRPLI